MKKLSFVREKYYFCRVYTHAVPSKSYIDRGWRDSARTEVDLMVVGGHYLMLKRHRCFVNDRSEPRKFKTISQRQCQKWLLRVWNNCVPGCVARVCNNPHAHFPRRYVQIPAWADTLLVTYRGFPRAKNGDEQRWKPTFCVQW